MKPPLFLLLSMLPLTVFGADSPPLPDSSFLVEEAWRSDSPVIQHTLSWDDGWAYSWTQEWGSPDQPHLFGYTIPFGLTEDNGLELGHLSLDYRWQAWNEAENGFAFSPRLSATVPLQTLSEEDARPRLGIELAFPLTIVRGDELAVHVCAGGSWLELEGGEHSTEIAIGASLVHVLGASSVGVLEAQLRRLDAHSSGTGTITEHELTISPGIRRATGSFAKLGIVPGLAIPITITSDGVSAGIVFHMMFEHTFRQE